MEAVEEDQPVCKGGEKVGAELARRENYTRHNRCGGWDLGVQ